MKVDINTIKKLDLYFIAENHCSDIPLNNQLELIYHCLNRARTLRDAVKLILANYEILIKEDKALYHIVRSYCGNHIYKNNQLACIALADRLGKYFNSILEHDRLEFIEILVRSRNEKTEKSIRKLFHGKFNCLPIFFKNSILKLFILDDNVPDYFFLSFLTDTKKGVSDKNKNLIVTRLRINELKKINPKTLKD